MLKRRVAWAGDGRAGCAVAPPRLPKRTRGSVVGGGCGGATAARYLRLLSVRRLEVMLVEPNENFISCPGSDVVPGGGKSIADFTLSHAGLSRRLVALARRDGGEGPRLQHRRRQQGRAAGFRAGDRPWTSWCCRSAAAKPRSEVLTRDADADMTGKQRCSRRSGPRTIAAWSSTAPSAAPCRSTERPARCVSKCRRVCTRTCSTSCCPCGPAASRYRLAWRLRKRAGVRSTSFISSRPRPGCPRARRFDPDRASDAEQRTHGQRPCKSGRGRDRGQTQRLGSRPGADVDEHLLQPCGREKRHSRGQRARWRGS